MSEDHEVVEEEDDLALEEVPQRFAPLLLLPRSRLTAPAEPVARVQVRRRERHAVHQLIRGRLHMTPAKSSDIRTPFLHCHTHATYQCVLILSSDPSQPSASYVLGP